MRVLGLLVLAACAPVTSSGLGLGTRTLDLTHAFNAKTVYWPTSPSGFTLTVLSHGKTPAGFFYAANTFAAPEHGGTHLDAPIHFADGRWTADAVPLEHLMAPAIVVDLSTRAASDRDALLLPADLDDFERRYGPIAKGTIVLVRTGWAARYSDKKSYLGDDTPGDASHLHFPGISPDAARGLVARGVVAVGIDTASIDNGPSTTFETHQVLMGANVPAFENVASMEALPPRGATVVALPMKIEGGTGAPLRIVAILP